MDYGVNFNQPSLKRSINKDLTKKQNLIGGPNPFPKIFMYIENTMMIFKVFSSERFLVWTDKISGACGISIYLVLLKLVSCEELIVGWTMWTVDCLLFMVWFRNNMFLKLCVQLLAHLFLINYWQEMHSKSVQGYPLKYTACVSYLLY